MTLPQAVVSLHANIHQLTVKADCEGHRRAVAGSDLILADRRESGRAVVIPGFHRQDVVLHGPLRHRGRVAALYKARWAVVAVVDDDVNFGPAGEGWRDNDSLIELRQAVLML